MTKQSKRRRLRRALQQFLLWFNLVQVFAWGLLIYPSMTIWSESLKWVVFMSVWANFAGAIAGLTAALLALQMDDDS